MGWEHRGMTRPAVAARRVGSHAALLMFWALDYGYVLRWQAMHVLRPIDPARYADPPGPHRAPLLVLPGILETWDFLRPLVEDLYERGHPIHVVTDLGRNRRPVPEMAECVERYLEEHELTEVVIVAHSKGGLIGKHVMSLGRCGSRVDAMVTVNTPFGGSRHARLIPTRAIRSFLPGDPTLLALKDAVVVNSRITSIGSRWDPHIPEGSVLAGATNVTLSVLGHFRVIGDPRLRRAVLVAAAGRAPTDSDPTAG